MEDTEVHCTGKSIPHCWEFMSCEWRENCRMKTVTDKDAKCWEIAGTENPNCDEEPTCKAIIFHTFKDCTDCNYQKVLTKMDTSIELLKKLKDNIHLLL